MFAEKSQLDANRSSNLFLLTRSFLLGGIFGIVAGFIHLTALVTNGFSPIRLGDFAINTVIGILAIVVYFLLKKQSMKAIWVFGAAVLASIIYGLAVGRGLNYLMLIVGVLVLGYFYTLKTQGQLR